MRAVTQKGLFSECSTAAQADCRAAREVKLMLPTGRRFQTRLRREWEPLSLIVILVAICSMVAKCKL